jgi:hypothetical protein
MTVAYFSSFQRKRSPFGFIQKVSPPTIPPFWAGFCPVPDFPLTQLFKKIVAEPLDKFPWVQSALRANFISKGKPCQGLFWHRLPGFVLSLLTSPACFSRVPNQGLWGMIPDPEG